MTELVEYLLILGKQANFKLLKAYEERPNTNPLFHRLSLLLNEFNFHLSEGLKNMDNQTKLKIHLEILYHDGVMINEMHTMLKRTENVASLKTDIDSIQEMLSQLVRYITEIYGYEKARYIVPSHFQQLSGLW